jgi:hypothetical protein
MPDLDRMASALALDHRAVIKQARNPGGVERRRHHQDAQILTQAGLDVERQRQAEISLRARVRETRRRSRIQCLRDPAMTAPCG